MTFLQVLQHISDLKGSLNLVGVPNRLFFEKLQHIDSIITLRQAQHANVIDKSWFYSPLKHNKNVKFLADGALFNNHTNQMIVLQYKMTLYRHYLLFKMSTMASEYHNTSHILQLGYTQQSSYIQQIEDLNNLPHKFVKTSENNVWTYDGLPVLLKDYSYINNVVKTNDVEIIHDAISHQKSTVDEFVFKNINNLYSKNHNNILIDENSKDVINQYMLTSSKLFKD